MKLHTHEYVGDPLILFILFILFCSGLITIYSATYSFQEISYSYYFCKQLLGMLLGISLGMIASYIPFQLLINWGKAAHFIVLALLTITLIKGSTSMGAQRWISLGFLKFQPSELTKLTLPLFITNYMMNGFYKNKKKILSWLYLCGIVFITFLLIAKQPDLGTAIIVSLSGLLILYIAGIPSYLLKSGFIGAIIITPFLWNMLHDYQKKRILVFIGHGESSKERYQLEQSKIAIGSGKIIGKGFLKGTQKNLKFLPESRTDFIFSVLAEEWGFLGITFILFLYIILIIRLFGQIEKIDSLYPYILSIGLSLSFILSVICNVGMTIGLLPIVGIPLPCISYGITNLWITLVSLGITNNILASCE